MDLKISDYLLRREKLLSDLEKQVELLKKMPASVKIRSYDKDDKYLDKQYFVCEDYSLATDFQIEKRREDKGGSHGYDGGYSSYTIETYPQFYFRVGETGASVRVDIQHSGYESDKRIVLKTVDRTDGCKEYTDMTRYSENEGNLEDVLKFFAKKGVNDNLLVRLKERVKECKRF